MQRCQPNTTALLPPNGGMLYLMALTNTYVQVYGQLGDVFQHLAQAQAPEKFTVQYLKGLGLRIHELSRSCTLAEGAWVSLR